MPENENNEEQQKKEEMRNLQMGFLGSESVKNLVIANAGKDVAQYGQIGKQATLENYLSALGNPDEHVSQILAQPYLQSAIGAAQRGQDVYEEGISMTHSKLLRIAKGAYIGGMDKIKVSDLLGMIGAENVHESNISAEQKEMYMEDFKEANKEMYGALKGVYTNSLEGDGVGRAIAAYTANQRNAFVEGLGKDPNAEQAR